MSKLNLDLIIKKATKDDLYDLKNISMNTFIETFAADNTPEDTKKYIDTNFTDEQVLLELNKKNSIFYLAMLNNKPVGYLKINFLDAQTEEQGNDAMEIQRIYILSEYKGKGIGTALMSKAEEEAKIAKVKRIWLGVWEHNDKAIAFYKKKGYKRFSEHTFMFGNDPQTDYLMEKFI